MSINASQQGGSVNFRYIRPKHMRMSKGFGWMICCCLLSLAACGQAGKQDVKGIYTYTAPSPDGTGKFFMGREIAPVMGAAGAAWLERPERQQEEKPALAIQNMKLRDTTVVADIGAGTGYYSFAIAKEVPQGKVYAVDIQPEMVDYLNEKKKSAGADNVIVVLGDSTSVKLPPHAIDLAIMVDVYHELEFPYEIIQSIKQSLRDDGRIVLIEYRGEDPAIPIKPLHKTTVKQLVKEFKRHGFKLSSRIESLPIQHYLEFTVSHAR